MNEISWALRYLRRHLSPRKTLRSLRAHIRAWKKFFKDYRLYVRLASPEKRPLIQHLYPCLGDDTEKTEIEPTYFYQDSWAFERIFQERPPLHVDIGSHHKYVALLSKVIPVAYVDLRPPSIRLDTLAFVQGSVLDLPFGSRSVSSLSCLCVIEHIGLGRYGDPLDPYGTEKAVQELKRVMQPGGDLYVSFPVDDANRTYFNAHRAFREKYMLGLFEPFAPLEKRYIFGKRFLERPDMGFGTACYHLRSPR